MGNTKEYYASLPFEEIRKHYEASEYYRNLKRHKRTARGASSDSEGQWISLEPHPRPQTVTAAPRPTLQGLRRLRSLTESELSYLEDIQPSRTRDLSELLLRRIAEKEREENRKWLWFWDDPSSFYFVLAILVLVPRRLTYIPELIFRPDYVIPLLAFAFLIGLPALDLDLRLGQIFHGSPVRYYSIAGPRGLGIALGSCLLTCVSMPYVMGQVGVTVSMAVFITSDWDKVPDGENEFVLQSMTATPRFLAVSLSATVAANAIIYWIVSRGTTNIRKGVVPLLFIPLFFSLIHSIFFFGDPELLEDFKAHVSKVWRVDNISLYYWEVAWEDALMSIPVLGGGFGTMASYNVTGAKTRKNSLVVVVIFFLIREIFLNVYSVLLYKSLPYRYGLFPSHIPIIANRIFLLEQATWFIAHIVVYMNILLSTLYDLFPNNKIHPCLITGVLVLLSLPLSHNEFLQSYYSIAGGMSTGIFWLYILHSIWIGWLVGLSHQWTHVNQKSNFVLFSCAWALCFVGTFLAGSLNAARLWLLLFAVMAALFSFIPILVDYYTTDTMQRNLRDTMNLFFLGNLEYLGRHLDHPVHSTGRPYSELWLLVIKYGIPWTHSFFLGVAIQEKVVLPTLSAKLFVDYNIGLSVGFSVGLLAGLIALIGLVVPAVYTWILPRTLVRFDQVQLPYVPIRRRTCSGILEPAVRGLITALRAQLVDFTCPKYSDKKC